MKVSAQYAQDHLPDILTAASSGEEVEISRPGQPSVRLSLVVSDEPTLNVSRLPRQPGRLKGIIEVPTDEEWAAMDKELEELMVNAPLTTDGDV